MSEYAIETNHLQKKFGSKVAVGDLTLQVKRGEVFGFLGPNGAGKTTSMKMLLGLVTPTSGTAQLLGQPMGHRPTRERVGYVPEHFRFYPWLKAGEFLDLQGRLYGMSNARRREVIQPLLERVGLGDRANTPLQAFSKGMTQRIGIAQAMMNEPDLVFLDEPTSGLDPIGRRLVREIIEELRSRGTAVFVNSHLLSEIEKTCDRVVFIREGRVVAFYDLHEWDDSAVQVKMRVSDQHSAELNDHLATIATHIKPSKNGVIHFVLSAESAVPSLVTWLVEKNIPLYELSPERLSLEDRFVQIIEKSNE